MADRIDRISTPAAAAPAGHYSQGTAWNDLVFVSGQLGPRPDGGHTSDQPFEVQARQALENVLAIVQEAGGRPEHILKVTAYVVGVENWGKFNKVYAEIFGDIRPARSVVPVPQLHLGYSIEVEAIAVKPKTSA